MKKVISNIRWRLALGLAAFVATIVLTLPAVASRQLEHQISGVWPNGLGPVADTIWPNGPTLEIIWPNGGISE